MAGEETDACPVALSRKHREHGAGRGPGGTGAFNSTHGPPQGAPDRGPGLPWRVSNTNSNARNPAGPHTHTLVLHPGPRSPVDPHWVAPSAPSPLAPGFRSGGRWFSGCPGGEFWPVVKKSTCSRKPVALSFFKLMRMLLPLLKCQCI